MATAIKFTKAQRDTMRQIASGLIIRKLGYGYEVRDERGIYIGKASIAVKSLGLLGLVANAGDRIYFTTRGYWKWYGGDPKGAAAQLVAAADKKFAWVQDMLMTPDAEEYKSVVNWWAS